MTGILQSIPSPMKIRAELERMVLKDLLGPVGGPLLFLSTMILEASG